MLIYTDTGKGKNVSLAKIHLTYVKYKGETLEFLTEVKLQLGMNTVNLYNPINDYVNTIFNEEKKETLFNLYKKAHEVFNPINIEDKEIRENYLDNLNNPQFLVHVLKPIVKDILDLIDYNQITHFITLSEDNILEVPPAVEEAANKGEYPEESTIHANDYKNIIKMIMYLRPIFPIILNFIDNINKFANKEYVEIMAGELFEDNYTLKNSPGYNKLTVFMKYKQMDNQVSKELDVLSGQNYVKYVIFNTIINRLLPAQLPSMDKSKNLSKLIYGGSQGLNSSKKISSPIFPGGGSSSEDKDKRSILESFKVKARVNQHKEMAQCEYFLMGVMDEYNNLYEQNIFEIQCMGLGINNRLLVEKLYHLIPNEWDFKLEEHISVLGQLVFFGKVSPEIVYSLDYNQLKAYMALAQAKLFEMGYPNLSVLMTAMFSTDEIATNVNDIFSLTKEDKASLLEICYITDDDKHATRNRAVEATTNFLESLGSYSLVSTISKDMLISGDILNKEFVFGKTYLVDIDRIIKEEFISLVNVVNH